MCKKYEVKIKFYDDCFYVIYVLLLFNGIEGYCVCSWLILKIFGMGKMVLDFEIERSERCDYYEGYFDDDVYINVESFELED